MMRFPILLSALLLAPGLVASDAHAASRDDRKTLVVRGRVTDREGWPVPGAKVTSAGSHRASVNVDRNGTYVLLVPVGSLDDVAKRPFEVTVDVMRRGWTFSLPGGASRLGIALRLEDAGGGVSRGRVRSNEPSAATAVAEALVLDGNASALVEMNFIGIEGAVVDTGTPKLDASQDVTLTGVSGVAVAVAAPPPPSRTPGVPTRATAPSTTSRATPAVPGATSAPTPASPPQSFTSPSTTTGSSPASAVVPVAPPPTRTPAPAPTTRPADRAPASPRADTVAGAPTTAPRVDSLASAPAAAPPTPAGSPRVHPGQKPIDQATSDTRLTTPPVVYPAPPRTRAAPDVPGDTTCTCRVYGTIEVFSEKRLPEPTRFDVRVVQIPAFRDTVELFMGSPRAFDFRTVPCGSLDLDIRTLGSRRFTVTSRDGREPLQCERGSQRHMRIVLEPR